MLRTDSAQEVRTQVLELLKELAERSPLPRRRQRRRARGLAMIVAGIATVALVAIVLRTIRSRRDDHMDVAPPMDDATSANGQAESPTVREFDVARPAG